MSSSWHSQRPNKAGDNLVPCVSKFTSPTVKTHRSLRSPATKNEQSQKLQSDSLEGMDKMSKNGSSPKIVVIRHEPNQETPVRSSRSTPMSPLTRLTTESPATETISKTPAVRMPLGMGKSKTPISSVSSSTPVTSIDTNNQKTSVTKCNIKISMKSTISRPTITSSNNKTPTKSTRKRSPSSENRTPLSGIKTPLATSRTPLKHNKTPNDSHTPSNDSQTPLLCDGSVKASAWSTPLTGNKTPSTDVRTPLTSTKTPLTTNKTPLSNNKTPITDKITPLSSNKAPSYERITPGVSGTVKVRAQCATPLFSVSASISSEKKPAVGPAHSRLQQGHHSDRRVAVSSPRCRGGSSEDNCNSGSGRGGGGGGGDSCPLQVDINQSSLLQMQHGVHKVLSRSSDSWLSGSNSGRLSSASINGTSGGVRLSGGGGGGRQGSFGGVRRSGGGIGGVRLSGGCTSLSQSDLGGGCYQASPMLPSTGGLDQAEDAPSAVTVAVRVRPLSLRERENPDIECVVSMSGNEVTITTDSSNTPHTFTCDYCFWSATPEDATVPASPKPASAPQTPSQYILSSHCSQSRLRRNGVSSINVRKGSSDPKGQKVIGGYNQNPPHASQKDVYEALARPLLDRAYQGYNVCLFAYGQTGSGKSYSIMGSDETASTNDGDEDEDEEAGIIPRFCRELFSRADQLQETSSGEELLDKPKVELQVELSYIEIYNEKIYDLVGGAEANVGMSGEQTGVGPPRESLRVREHPELGPHVVGAAVHPVTTYQDLMTWLTLGNRERSIAATGMNEKSSRSHSVFTLRLTHTQVESLDGDTVRHSRVSNINIVDLAGSERIAASNITGDRLKEGVCINKSLLTLGKVITALSECALSRRRTFVPYRESILTWLLKESLGGNSHTAMLATISPVSTHAEESLATLRYAGHARNILNTNHINEDPAARIIRSLKAELERLRAQRAAVSPCRLFPANISDDEEEEKEGDVEDNSLKEGLIEAEEEQRMTEEKRKREEERLQREEEERRQLVLEKEAEIQRLKDELMLTRDEMNAKQQAWEARLQESENAKSATLERCRKTGVIMRSGGSKHSPGTQFNQTVDLNIRHQYINSHQTEGNGKSLFNQSDGRDQSKSPLIRDERNQDNKSCLDGGVDPREGPCLINLCDDPQLSQKLVYCLSAAKTTLGRSRRADLTLRNLHADIHCTITNVGDNTLSVSPLPEQDTYVNGVLVTQPTSLCHDDRLVLAGIYFFRVLLSSCDTTSNGAFTSCSASSPVPRLLEHLRYESKESPSNNKPSPSSNKLSTKSPKGLNLNKPSPGSKKVISQSPSKLKDSCHTQQRIDFVFAQEELLREQEARVRGAILQAEEENRTALLLQLEEERQRLKELAGELDSQRSSEAATGESQAALQRQMQRQMQLLQEDKHALQLQLDDCQVQHQTRLQDLQLQLQQKQEQDQQKREALELQQEELELQQQMHRELMQQREEVRLQQLQAEQEDHLQHLQALTEGGVDEGEEKESDEELHLSPPLNSNFIQEVEQLLNESVQAVQSGAETGKAGRRKSLELEDMQLWFNVTEANRLAHTIGRDYEFVRQDLVTATGAQCVVAVRGGCGGGGSGGEPRYRRATLDCAAFRALLATMRDVACGLESVDTIESYIPWQAGTASSVNHSVVPGLVIKMRDTNAYRAALNHSLLNTSLNNTFNNNRAAFNASLLNTSLNNTFNNSLSGSLNGSMNASLNVSTVSGAGSSKKLTGQQQNMRRKIGATLRIKSALHPHTSYTANCTTFTKSSAAASEPNTTGTAAAVSVAEACSAVLQGLNVASCSSMPPLHSALADAARMFYNAKSLVDDTTVSQVSQAVVFVSLLTSFHASQRSLASVITTTAHGLAPYTLQMYSPLITNNKYGDNSNKNCTSDVTSAFPNLSHFISSSERCQTYGSSNQKYLYPVVSGDMLSSHRLSNHNPTNQKRSNFVGVNERVAAFQSNNCSQVLGRSFEEKLRVVHDAEVKVEEVLVDLAATLTKLYQSTSACSQQVIQQNAERVCRMVLPVVHAVTHLSVLHAAVPRAAVLRQPTTGVWDGVVLRTFVTGAAAGTRALLLHYSVAVSATATDASALVTSGCSAAANLSKEYSICEDCNSGQLWRCGCSVAAKLSTLLSATADFIALLDGHDNETMPIASSHTDEPMGTQSMGSEDKSDVCLPKPVVLVTSEAQENKNSEIPVVLMLTQEAKKTSVMLINEDSDNYSAAAKTTGVILTPEASDAHNTSALPVNTAAEADWYLDAVASVGDAAHAITTPLVAIMTALKQTAGSGVQAMQDCDVGNIGESIVCIQASLSRLIDAAEMLATYHITGDVTFVSANISSTKTGSATTANKIFASVATQKTSNVAAATVTAASKSLDELRSMTRKLSWALKSLVTALADYESDTSCFSDAPTMAAEKVSRDFQVKNYEKTNKDLEVKAGGKSLRHARSGGCEVNDGRNSCTKPGNREVMNEFKSGDKTGSCCERDVEGKNGSDNAMEGRVNCNSDVLEELDELMKRNYVGSIFNKDFDFGSLKRCKKKVGKENKGDREEKMLTKSPKKLDIESRAFSSPKKRKSPAKVPKSSTDIQKSPSGHNNSPKNSSHKSVSSKFSKLNHVRITVSPAREAANSKARSPSTNIRITASFKEDSKSYATGDCHPRSLDTDAVEGTSSAMTEFDVDLSGASSVDSVDWREDKPPFKSAIKVRQKATQEKRVRFDVEVTEQTLNEYSSDGDEDYIVETIDV